MFLHGLTLHHSTYIVLSAQKLQRTMVRQQEETSYYDKDDLKRLLSQLFPEQTSFKLRVRTSALLFIANPLIAADEE